MKIIIQISLNNSKTKIQNSLDKCTNFKSFQYKFITLNNDTVNLKNKIFLNTNDLIFNSKNDIQDFTKILKEIYNLAIEKLESE